MEPLKFGRLWQETQHVVRRHIGMTLPVVGLFMFLPQLLMAWQVGDRPPAQMFQTLSPGLLVFPLALLMGLAGQLVLYFIAWHDGTDGKRLGEVLQLAGRRLLPAIAVSLMQGIAMGMVLIPAALLVSVLGLPLQLVPLLLIVPALWIFSRFIPALPLLMAGVSDPLAALRQGWRLTRGQSFRILASILTLLFGLLLVLTAMSGLAQAVGVVTTIVAGKPAAGWGIGRWLFELASTGFAAVFSLYFSSFVARLSRALKGGNAA